jgi:hypothetical protein
MKLILGILLALNLETAFASGVSWTSIKACHQGYDVQMMTGWANSNYVTKYVLSIRRESLDSLVYQLNQVQKLTEKEIQELEQSEVSTPSYGRFEADLTFGKIVAQELENGTKVNLNVYDKNGKEIANYYFNRCY